MIISSNISCSDVILLLQNFLSSLSLSPQGEIDPPFSSLFLSAQALGPSSPSVKPFYSGEMFATECECMASHSPLCYPRRYRKLIQEQREHPEKSKLGPPPLKQASPSPCPLLRHTLSHPPPNVQRIQITTTKHSAVILPRPRK